MLAIEVSRRGIKRIWMGGDVVFFIVTMLSTLVFCHVGLTVVSHWGNQWFMHLWALLLTIHHKHVMIVGSGRYRYLNVCVRIHGMMCMVHNIMFRIAFGTYSRFWQYIHFVKLAPRPSKKRLVDFGKFGNTDYFP